MAQSDADSGRGTRSAERAADGSGADTLAPGREWFVGAYGGAPYTYDSDVVVRKPGQRDFTVKGVRWDGKPFKDPIYYGVRIARWPGEGAIGGMLDFTHSKTISRPTDTFDFSGTLDGQALPPRARVNEVFRRLEFSHGHNMLTLNGLVRLPRLAPRLKPYIGLGLGVGLPHSELHLVKDPKRTYEYQYAGPVGQALIGLEFRLPRLSYFVEYKFSLAAYLSPLSGQDGSWLPLDLWRQFQRWRTNTPPPDGTLATRLTSHQIIGGIGVRIVPGAITVRP